MSEPNSSELGTRPADDSIRPGIRAFLQRCEVRLSTIHRVATALLSGAGILVLLPALQRDAIETVLRSLLTALRSDQRTDRERVASLLELAAARSRPLIEEAVKVELGLARHVLRLQVVVLRYVKALLVVVTTVLATYIASAATGDSSASTVADQRWIGAAYCMWAPMVIIAATAPVRWIESLLRAEGATRSSVRADPEFTRVENITSIIAIVVWVMSATATMILLFDSSTSTRACTSGIVVLVSSATMLVVSVGLWRRGEPARRCS